jgi:cytochrome oxidase assembly protein ShyY1
MADKLMTLLVGLLIALGGWSLSRTFELSTIQAVHEDKVHTLQAQVLKLEEQVDKMMDSDEDIMDQHKKLFNMLENNESTSGSYNY